MGYQLISNRKPRPLVSLHDLPESARAYFDYVSEDDSYSERFFSYLGNWYDAFDAQRITSKHGGRMGWERVVHPGEPMARYDAVASDSFFSGVVWAFTADDSVIVGRYFS